MNKREVIWLIIRLIGAYFAYLAVISVFGLIGSISNYASLPSPKQAAETQKTRSAMPGGMNNPEIEPPVKTETETVADKSKSEAFKLIFWFILLIGLYGAAGWYLIRDGKFLYKILSREDNSDVPKEEKPQVTSLNL